MTPSEARAAAIADGPGVLLRLLRGEDEFAHEALEELNGGVLERLADAAEALAAECRDVLGDRDEDGDGRG